MGSLDLRGGANWERNEHATILIILLILLLIGSLPTWPYSAGWGITHRVASGYFSSPSSSSRCSDDCRARIVAHGKASTTWAAQDEETTTTTTHGAPPPGAYIGVPGVAGVKVGPGAGYTGGCEHRSKTITNEATGDTMRKSKTRC